MTLNSVLQGSEMRFILFGGKGGVGKTSCASATALWSAEQGQKTLIISTDPAHSISDSFKQDLHGGVVKPIAGVDNLYALEIDPKKALQTYQEQMGKVEDDTPIQPLMSDPSQMTFPGIDEGLAFTKVLEYMQTEEYDLVVFDTAPTGHTLRLLSLPDVMSSFLGRMITAQLKLRDMLGGFKRFLGKMAPKDNTLELLQKQKDTIQEARVVLSDDKQTMFVPVMIPEAMAISETERLLSTLTEYEIPVSHIIINKLVPDAELCQFCASRRKMQQENYREIKEIYEGDFNLIPIPLFNTEITGIDKLKELSKLLLESA